MSAVFSECGEYRYRLDRRFGDGPPVGFLLHNPSTAGVTADDATSRRGIGYAKSLGFGRLIFVNPWAKIATDPRDLWAAEDPVGPLNDDHLQDVVMEISREGGRMIAAWGRIAPPSSKRTAASTRIAGVLNLVERNGVELFALGTNKDGSPKHPLYLRRDAELSLWAVRDSHSL